MSSSLSEFLNQTVKVITTDGRLFIGLLQGFDQSTNIILSNTKERIIDPEEPVEDIDLGLYMLRGDCVVCIGTIDEELENEIKWEDVRGSTLKGTKNPL